MDFKPIADRSRIQVVDAVRGFALFGVLLANIPYAYEGGLNTALDPAFKFFYHLLIENKFIAIFSMLFGFGFSIQMRRAKEKQVHFIRYFSVRMLLLFLIGSAHAYFLWNGDIIRAYALGGMFLLLLRKWSSKKLLILALTFIVLLTGAIFIGNDAFGWRTYHYDYALANEYPITKSLWRYLEINVIMDPWCNFLQDMPITLAYTFGNMLIGFVLGKVDFFRRPARLKKLTTWLIISGSTLGLGASYVYYKIVTGAIEFNLSLLWLPFVVLLGMLLQSLAYVSIFMRLFHTKRGRRILQFFSPVGKTSLSNYLLQSVLYVLVFYHCTHALQLYGKVSLSQTYLLASGFFVLQTLASCLWLKKHQQGPLEGLWKRISYGVVPPKMVANAATQSLDS